MSDGLILMGFALGILRSRVISFGRVCKAKNALSRLIKSKSRRKEMSRAIYLFLSP